MNKIFFLLSLLFLSVCGFTQSDDPLVGLTKINPEELGEKLMLTPDVMVFNTEMEKIDVRTFFDLVQSGDYTTNVYVDEAKKLKALTLQELSEEEKAKKQKVAGAGNQGSAHVDGETPAFTLTDLEGNTYSNESLAGKIAVLNFWFVNCKPCVMEIPELNEVVHTYESHKDVVFIAVALDSPEKIHTFLEKHPFAYSIIPDGMNTSGVFGVGSYPTHIIIGRDGKTAYRTSGLGPTTVSDLNAKIEELL